MSFNIRCLVEFVCLGKPFLFNKRQGEKDEAEVERDGLLSEFNGAGTLRVNFFQEVLSGSSPNGELGNIVGAVKDETGIMLQACGEWSNQAVHGYGVIGLITTPRMPV